MSRFAHHLLIAAAGTGQGYVRFTTTGATFSPAIELASGSPALVTWLVEETGVTATGLTPTIDFGSSGTRHVRMSACWGRGLGDVVTVNLDSTAGRTPEDTTLVPDTTRRLKLFRHRIR
jgi:hypothetical protein